jgi:hypothetical protein
MKFICSSLRAAYTDLVQHAISYAFWFTVGASLTVIVLDVFVWRK